MSKYSLRPLQRKSDYRDIYRIFVPSKLYVSLRASTKDLWILEDDTGNAVATGRISQAQDEVQNKVLQVSQEFKDLFGLSFSESYTLKRSDAKPQHAAEIVLQQEVSSNLQSASSEEWTGFLKATLAEKIISPGLCIEDIRIADQKHSFKVKEIRPAGLAETLCKPLDLCMFTVYSRIRIEDLGFREAEPKKFSINRNGLFGMDEQLDQLDSKLQYHKPTERSPRGLSAAGFLLIGPSGSGKSLLIDRITDLQWQKKTVITKAEIGNNPSTSLTKIFSDGLNHQPALIVVEDFADLRASLGSGLESALKKAFKIIRNARVLVVIETQSETMSPRFSRCFKTQVQMPSLDENSRRDLIRHTFDAYESGVTLPLQMPTIIAETTPGYTGEDVESLIEEAICKAETRLGLTKALDTSAVDMEEQQDPAKSEMTLEDIEQAKKSIPLSTTAQAGSARRKVVKWSDIGGQEELKEKVEEHFVLPLKYRDRFTEFDLKSSKGMLLYGPPGCSKTMTALALATEAKLNFIPIKGPELLTKYVGESESKLRDIFQQARNVAPCVIFFDEIDSINSSGEGTGGIKLIETLLNELDGVDDVGNVYVLAATNKPWEMDQALLRRGRFDTLFHVKLPDANTRREIIEIQIKRLHHEALNLDSLVEMTEGCSGAEIVGFCQDAKMAAFKEQIHLTTTAIAARHFDKALANLRKDTSIDMVAMYDKFERNQN